MNQRITAMAVNNTKKEGYKINRPYVADNTQGGVFQVLVDTPIEEPVLVAEIRQVETWLEGEKVKRKTRKGYIEGPFENMMCISWEPKSVVGGKVRVIEQIEPPVEEDPEMFLSYRNGKIRRHCGRPIYSLQVYVFKANAEDIYLEDD